ncbi:GNAT family N-acetyltransferase [Flavobacterium sangjuense]|uniref:Ribosomal N-acetyltransferase YdaF n=1 Tax=Flavobacterium sangjuense TaxID=2518177 RepID=A0A4P7PUQ8_9FLAO|nr:GNAT family protein [Flavobacterium sangjuense]QBZ97633.1 Putative ribosomal N-acetyltransferase YdaF [Flavobacterium sangjuense]
MIHFENYTVRRIVISDLENYFSLIENNRKRLEDFFTGTVSRTRTFEDTETFLREIIQKRYAKLYYAFVIENDENKELVGFIDIKNIDWNIPKAELGFYTDEQYSGKGISSKAFSLFVDYCFDHFGFSKLFLRTHESNIAAQKLAQKAGFQIEGKIRKDYKTTKGEVVDLIYYGKIRE